MQCSESIPICVLFHYFYISWCWKIFPQAVGYGHLWCYFVFSEIIYKIQTNKDFILQISIMKGHIFCIFVVIQIEGDKWEASGGTVLTSGN